MRGDPFLALAGKFECHESAGYLNMLAEERRGATSAFLSRIFLVTGAQAEPLDQTRSRRQNPPITRPGQVAWDCTPNARHGPHQLAEPARLWPTAHNPPIPGQDILSLAGL